MMRSAVRSRLAPPTAACSFQPSKPLSTLPARRSVGRPVMHGFLDNLILNTDSYKASHFLQYPPGSEEVSSYVESRGGRFPHTLFFGLQAFIKQYLLTPITHDDVGEAEALLTAHGVPFNRAGWLRIVTA